MRNEMATFILLFVSLVLKTGISALEVSLTNSGPTVRGSNVTFTATITSGYTGNELKYEYQDDATAQHNNEFTSSNKTVSWTVEYARNDYEAGQYFVKLVVKNYLLVWYTVATCFTAFNLTDTLHGNMVLSQNETERPNEFVATNQPVMHTIKLLDNELQFLRKNSSSILTYWFMDCVLIAETNDFYFNYTYTDAMGAHGIEAIVVANNEPLPPITTTTTTTTTSTTTTTTTTTTPKPNTSISTLPPPTSTAPPTTSTIPPATSLAPHPTSTVFPKSTMTPNTTETVDAVVNTSVHKVKKRSISNRTTMKGEQFCNNTLPVGAKHTIGRYHRNIAVRDPISTVNISGSNWLQHGDLLNLNVKYSGSPPFDYCILYKVGQYNVTGNETCKEMSTTKSNTFPLIHYFLDSDQHTVVVLINNDVGRTISKVTVNIYKANVHAQLSVIVVPVFFCLVAVILVVFGIAYYQHRSRHTVEVADFDFGQAYLDYKTFNERLRDSFRNAFNFRQRGDTDPLTSNTRYDSMT